MTVFNPRIFIDQDYRAMRGASMLEVILAMAIVALITPFMFDKMADANRTVADIATAQRIIDLRGPMLNFVRMNQDSWPDNAQIKFSDEELDSISEIPEFAIIDKRTVRGATISDVYLAFDLGTDELHANKIARQIGADATVVGPDGVAYGADFAVAAPEFKPGYLIYRISRSASSIDTSIYLHRASSGDDGLNVMHRNLNMGGNDIFSVSGIFSQNADVRDASTVYLETPTLTADNIYFSSGANFVGADAVFASLRVTGDISGFKNISADTLNGDSYTTSGHIITDKATVNRSVNVARDFVLKSDTARTVSGFTGITANSVSTPYISASEVIFFEDFGLTLSGELLMSTTAPLKIGDWTFPSNKLPQFSTLNLARGRMPSAPRRGEFDMVTKSGWQDVTPNMAPTTSPMAPIQIRSIR